MSIRFKLIISYVLMTIIPIVLFVLFLHLLFHLFLTNVEEMQEYYQLEDEESIEAFFYEDLALITEVKQVVLANPAQLLNSSFVKTYEEKLEQRQMAILVRKGQEITNGSNLETNELVSGLPGHNLGVNQVSANHQGHIGEDDSSWLYTGVDFYFDDGDEGTVFITLDVKPVQSLITDAVPLLIAGFVLAFLLANGLITYVISRQFIRPLKKLQLSAAEIAEGNLAQETGVVQKDEIGQLALVFDEMREKLKRSEDLQEQYEENRKKLINNISHDLKTPITAIKGHVQGITDGIAKDQNKLDKYVQVIQRKATEMDRLINELLLFSKLDLNSIPFQFEKVKASDYISDIVEAARVEYGGVEVTMDLQIDAETSIWADREQLYKVFANLLANSVKFMDKDRRKMDIRVLEEHRFLKVTIIDNGKGIGEEDLPSIFDRFYRVETSRNAELGGSGIGLAIAKQIIDAHNGEMGVTSKLGKGTAIYFTVPLAP
ncbi:HAMP domain-containing sensor histidine kinase [Bacillus sp. JCM 19041]|uniref:sensor histidine kinase n=1 Tax=Bacillus sp. JCM 19041 TaxID=1460637 RepID=UPI0006D0FB5A